MKALLLITCAAQLLCAQTLLRRPIASAGCTTPAGTMFTESFGDAATAPLTYGFSSTTDAQWVLTGTGASIVSSPGSPADNTACTNSLHMVTGTANNYIQTVGYTPTVPSGTTFDVTIYIYPTATSLGAYNAQSIFVPSADSSGVNYPCRIESRPTSSGTFPVRGAGSSVSSDSSNMSLNAWHTIQLHCASGANASYVKVDGGSNLTFTANSQAFNYATIGAISGNLQSLTYDIGYLSIDSAVGSGYLTYVDFEDSTDGTTFTSTIFNNGTRCGNGTWTAQASGTPATAEKVASAAQLSLTTPVTACGTSYTDSGGTRGLRFDLSATTAMYASYQWRTNSPTASVGFWFKTTVPTSSTDYIAGFGINNVLASDFANMMQYNGQLYLETFANPNGNPDTGSKFNYTANTKYFIAITFEKYTSGSSKHTMKIYDSSCSLLSTQTKAARSTSPSNPNLWIAGRGGDSGTPAENWYIDNAQINYTTGQEVACK